jgi:hypothetical protein
MIFHDGGSRAQAFYPYPSGIPDSSETQFQPESRPAWRRLREAESGRVSVGGITEGGGGSERY